MEPVRVLFLCTGNSARSQVAEALLRHRGGGRVVAGSAGSTPRDRVHPLAVRVLHEHGIEWAGRQPRSIDDAAREPWDLVVTVCSRAREACPVLPGGPPREHWELEDPAAVEGEDERRRAFDATFDDLSGRIDDTLQRLPERRQHRSG